MLKFDEMYERALAVYMIVQSTHALPQKSTSAYHDKLRVFVDNYKSVLTGKRKGTKYDLVTRVLYKCVKGLSRVPMHCTKKVLRKCMVGRVNDWCRCKRVLGEWPSIKCYNKNRLKWDSLFSHINYRQLIHQFRSFCQSGQMDAGCCYPGAMQYMRQLDPFVFDHKYKRKTSPSLGINMSTSAYQDKLKYVNGLPSLV